MRPSPDTFRLIEATSNEAFCAQGLAAAANRIQSTVLIYLQCILIRCRLSRATLSHCVYARRRPTAPFIISRKHAFRSFCLALVLTSSTLSARLMLTLFTRQGGKTHASIHRSGNRHAALEGHRCCRRGPVQQLDRVPARRAGCDVPVHGICSLGKATGRSRRD